MFGVVQAKVDMLAAMVYLGRYVALAGEGKAKHICSHRQYLNSSVFETEPENMRHSKLDFFCDGECSEGWAREAMRYC